MQMRARIGPELKQILGQWRLIEWIAWDCLFVIDQTLSSIFEGTTWTWYVLKLNNFSVI